MRKKIFVLFALVGCGLVSFSNGCDMGPKEGDPCNALIAVNECSEPFTCQIIGSCTVGYCCPANASSSTNQFCNGTSCPPLPAGDDGGTDDAGNDASTGADTSTGGDTSTGADTSTEAETSTGTDTGTGADTSTEADTGTGADTSTSDSDTGPG